MISIVPVSNKASIPFSSVQPNSLAGKIPVANSAVASTNIKDSKNLLQEGNEYLKTNDFDSAIGCYKRSIELRPDFVDTYFPLGKAYKGKEDYSSAISSFETYVSAKPNDVESNIFLGECYNKQGMYAKAQTSYEKVISIEPNNDLAKRSLLETKNNVLSCYDPITAMKQKREQSVNNLNQALAMAKGYLPAGYLKDMGDLTIAFDKTAKLGGTSNIAQYEHGKRKITVTDSYVYAAPQIISSYLVHEFVHAKDKDSYTSITEEQDAYKTATEFWIKNSNSVSDPEMDYAGDLYKEAPSTLDARVAEIYKLRDPKIAQVSPNHPPNSKNVASSSLSELNCGQPLKDYDIIS